MKKDNFTITAEGYLKLEEELNELKNVESNGIKIRIPPTISKA